MTAVVWGGKTGAGLDVGCGEGDGGQRMASGFLVEGEASSAVRTQEPGLGEGHEHRGSTSGLSHPQPKGCSQDVLCRYLSCWIPKHLQGTWAPLPPYGHCSKLHVS